MLTMLAVMMPQCIRAGNAILSPFNWTTVKQLSWEQTQQRLSDSLFRNEDPLRAQMASKQRYASLAPTLLSDMPYQSVEVVIGDISDPPGVRRNSRGFVAKRTFFSLVESEGEDVVSDKSVAHSWPRRTPRRGGGFGQAPWTR